MRNEILKLLETDSRLTVKDIAAMIGADEAAVEADIKAMEDESIICGYHTMIDWDKVGEEMVTAMIEVKVHHREKRDLTRSRIVSEISMKYIPST